MISLILTWCFVWVLLWIILKATILYVRVDVPSITRWPQPIFAWYDLWVGFFVDRKKRKVYIFPIPVLGFMIEWKST